MNSFTYSLALKQRLGATRKRPIKKARKNQLTLLLNILSYSFPNITNCGEE